MVMANLEREWKAESNETALRPTDSLASNHHRPPQLPFVTIAVLVVQLQCPLRVLKRFIEQFLLSLFVLVTHVEIGLAEEMCRFGQSPPVVGIGR